MRSAGNPPRVLRRFVLSVLAVVWVGIACVSTSAAVTTVGSPIGAGVASGSLVALPVWAPSAGDVVLLTVAQRDRLDR